MPSGFTAYRSSALLLVLMLVNIINMIDRNLIASFSPEIVAELGLSNTQYGLLTGPLFVFFYATAGLFVGRMADRMHRGRLIASGLFLWSLLTVFSGLARSFLHLALARIFIGVGEATLSPASMSILSDVFRQKFRATVIGIYYLGMPLGVGASFIIAGVLGPQLGWRNCFYLLGFLGIALIPLVFWMGEPPRDAVTQADSSNWFSKFAFLSGFRELVTAVRSSQALKWAMVGTVFMHLPIGSGQFAQLWLVNERGFELSQINRVYGLLFLVFGVFGMLLGGIASDWYLNRFTGGRLRFFSWLLIGLLPFMVGYRFFSPDSIWFYIGMCSGFICFTASFGPVFSTVQEMVAPNMRGLTTAFLLFASNLIGLGVGAFAVGVLADLFQSIGSESPLTLAMLGIDSISIITIIAFWKASRH